jgi:hypothetical protein
MKKLHLSYRPVFGRPFKAADPSAQALALSKRIPASSTLYHHHFPLIATYALPKIITMSAAKFDKAVEIVGSMPKVR